MQIDGVINAWNASATTTEIDIPGFQEHNLLRLLENFVKKER